MRRILVAVAAMALTMSACAEDQPAIQAPTSPSSPSPAQQTAAECAASATLVTEETLTVGTDNPAFPPYFSGGETEEHAEWEFNDPYTGEGFEAGVAYEVAARLGFTEDQVAWTPVPFTQSFKPGPKDFDFDINQIGFREKRAGAVDFSDSYYEVNKGLVAVEGTPITAATSIDDLKDFTLAAQIASTDYDFIVEVIQPNQEPGAYNTLADAVAAINAGQVDGLIVDLPTAFFMADPFVQEVKDGVVVGQFPPAPGGEHFGMTFEKGNPLRDCVNLAIQEMTADGTLEAITTEWLSVRTNVGEVPVFTTS
jgi:polar amino acid transport system substrate-binding protein